MVLVVYLAEAVQYFQLEQPPLVVGLEPQVFLVGLGQVVYLLLFSQQYV